MPDGTIWNWIVVDWTEDPESIVKFTLCFDWKRMLVKLACMLWVVEVIQSFHGSLNDDGESNVLEGIQNLELLTDLRGTSWRKVDVVLIGLVCSCFLCFSSCVLVLELDHVYVVQLSCHGKWWEPGKKLRRNLSLTKREIWCHDCRHIALSWHDMDLDKTYHTSEIIRMDQTLKGGQRSLQWWNCESCSVRRALTASSFCADPS